MSCSAKEHNIPVRARTQTAQSGVRSDALNITPPSVVKERNVFLSKVWSKCFTIDCKFTKLTVVKWFVRSVNQQANSVAAAFDQRYSISVWNIFRTSSIDF